MPSSRRLSYQEQIKEVMGWTKSNEDKKSYQEFRRAVQKLVERHLEYGTPITQQKDGRNAIKRSIIRQFPNLFLKDREYKVARALAFAGRLQSARKAKRQRSGPVEKEGVEEEGVEEEGDSGEDEGCSVEDEGRSIENEGRHAVDESLGDDLDDKIRALEAKYAQQCATIEQLKRARQYH